MSWKHSFVVFCCIFHPEVRVDTGFLTALDKAVGQRGVFVEMQVKHLAHACCTVLTALLCCPHACAQRTHTFGASTLLYVPETLLWQHRDTVRNYFDVDFVAFMLKSPFSISWLIPKSVHTQTQTHTHVRIETWCSASPWQCNKTRRWAQAWVPVNFPSVNSCLLVSFYTPPTVPISQISVGISIRYPEKGTGSNKPSPGLFTLHHPITSVPRLRIVAGNVSAC